MHPTSRMQGESAQTSSNLGREQDCMEPTPVGLRACLSDVPPRRLRRQLTRARLALRRMGHPGFQVAQEAGTERRIRAPATHHLFRGSTRVHWPGSWMEASRQTGPFPPSEMKALPCPQTNRRSPQSGGLNALVHSRSLGLFICIHFAVSPTAWLGPGQS